MHGAWQAARVCVTPAMLRAPPPEGVVSLGADRAGSKGQGDNAAFETSHQLTPKQIINMQKHQLEAEGK